MDTPLISVIVPVYNSAEVLPVCLDSLKGQSLEQLEIILVDDGSTDGSDRIMKKYAEMDPRFLYIHERNRGVSAARNVGLKRAAGRYVMFADSDDCIDRRAAELLVQRAEESGAGWVVGGVQKTVRGVPETVLPEEGVYSGRNMDEALWQLFENHMLRQLWGKLYLGRIIREYELYLREDMSCGEDFEWICRYLIHVQTMAAVPEVLYHYTVRNSSSLSQRFDPHCFYHLKLEYEALKALFTARGIWQTYEEMIVYQEGYEILRGYGKITSAECPLTFREKKAYIRDGVLSPLRLEYLSTRKRLLPFFKDLTLRISSACFVTVAVLVLKRPSV